MKLLIILLVLVPAFVVSKKCTNPTGQPATGGTTSGQEATTSGQEGTTEMVESTTPEVETTTPYFPPPEDWPKGKWSLMRAGDSCPDFFKFKAGYRYQDSEDYRNGNSWMDGFSGKMKSDGYELHYCSKNKNKGVGHWPAGNYCLNRVGNKCPRGFASGSIYWDDENTFNTNSRQGYLPSGTYNDNTLQYFCCRNDSSINTAIDLPVTKPFFLYPYEGGCQKVRGMNVVERMIQFDDEDSENQNQKTGAHPMSSGNSYDHLMHYCRYDQKAQAPAPEGFDVYASIEKPM